MSDKILNELEHLEKKRIWVTKKARMESETRLNRNNMISLFLTNYYTFFVLSFSIWVLISEDTTIALLTVIATIGLFGISLFISYVGYREKAIQFKNSYTQLDKLESDVKNIIRQYDLKDNQELIKDLHLLEEKYNDIISKTENHSSIDFYKLIIDRKFDGLHDVKYKYYFKVSIRWIFIILLFLLPPTLFIYFLI